jgi:hypothetical protein
MAGLPRWLMRRGLPALSSDLHGPVIWPSLGTGERLVRDKTSTSQTIRSIEDRVDQ